MIFEIFSVFFCIIIHSLAFCFFSKRFAIYGCCHPCFKIDTLGRQNLTITELLVMKGISQINILLWLKDSYILDMKKGHV